MKKNFISLLLFVSAVAFTSCDKNTNENIVDPESAKVLVLNEGNYGKGNATLSAVSYEGELTNNLFQTTNNLPLGDVGQSINYFNGKYFTVLNSGRKLQVFGADDYKLLETIAIDDADYSPMYMAKISSSRAILTGSDFYTTYKGCLYVIDTQNNEFVETIEVAQNCNTAICSGDNLFVNAPVVYDWSDYPSVSVLLEGKVFVFDINNLNTAPAELNISLIDKSQFVTDKNGKIWALGNGEIFRINPSSITIEETITLNATTDYSSRLTINSAGDKLYFNAPNSNYETEIYSLSISSTSDLSEFKPEGLQIIYNMAMSPDDQLYINDALDYSQTGIVYIYDLDGELVNKYSTGINPNGILFTENNQN